MGHEGCCVLDHKRKKCVDIDFDDSGCVNLAKCCVGIHDQGKHAKCTSKVRQCRKLGNSRDPIGPLRPLPMEYIYTETPGYATTGALVEGFDGGILQDLLEQLFDIDCVMKNALCSFVIALVAKAVFEQKVTMSRMVFLTIVISIVKCCAAKL